MINFKDFQKMYEAVYEKPEYESDNVQRSKNLQKTATAKHDANLKLRKAKAAQARADRMGM